MRGADPERLSIVWSPIEYKYREGKLKQSPVKEVKIARNRKARKVGIGTHAKVTQYNEYMYLSNNITGAMWKYTTRNSNIRGRCLSRLETRRMECQSTASTMQ